MLIIAKGQHSVRIDLTAVVSIEFFDQEDSDRVLLVRSELVGTQKSSCNTVLALEDLRVRESRSFDLEVRQLSANTHQALFDVGCSAV